MVFAVIVVIYFAGSKVGAGAVAGRTVGVVEDEFAASKDGLG